MAISSEQTKEVIRKYGTTEKDTGRTEVQIALYTQRILSLQPHFSQAKKDHHSRRGLLSLVNKRRRLLRYLERLDIARYRKLCSDLGLRH
jgi:small subunit ribosomal protein S15